MQWIHMEIMPIALIALCASCNDKIPPEDIPNHETDHRMREWIQENGIDEIYQYKLHPDDGGFQIEAILMGSRESAEAGLLNFPSSKDFIMNSIELGLEQAMLIHSRKTPSKANITENSFQPGSRQELFLWGSKSAFHYEGFTIEDFHQFFHQSQ